MVVAVLVTLRPAWQYLATGKILVHWSQVGLAGFCFLFGVQLVALAALDRIFATLLQTETKEPGPKYDQEQIIGG